MISNNLDITYIDVTPSAIDGSAVDGNHDGEINLPQNKGGTNADKGGFYPVYAVGYPAGYETGF